MIHTKLMILISVCIVATGLRADLSVSYQTFKPDDVVIEVGRWKMKAKELEKYGIEPLKVVMVNDGMCEELFTLDRLGVSADRACQTLKSSLITVGLKSLLAGYISTNIVIPITYFVVGAHLLRPKADEDFGSYYNRLNLALIKEFPQTSLVLCIVAPVVVCSYAIRSVGIAHQYNQDLSAWCSTNLISSAVVIQPQQQITKLLFVDANASKFFFNPVDMCVRNS